MSNPKPEKSICLAVGILAQAVEFISDSIVDPNKDGNNNNCDLFVSEKIDQSIVEQAYNTLKPGGNLYLEWSVRFPSQITPTLKLLNSKGFNEISTYVPKPDPSQSPPYTWIPLESPGAAELLMMKFNKTKYTTSINIILSHLRRLLWKYYPKLFMTYPWLLTSSLKRFSLCTVAHKPLDIIPEEQTQQNFDPINQISRNNLGIILNENWKSWGLGEKPNNLSALTLTGGGSSYNNVVSIFFAEIDRNPKLVIKFPRTKESALFILNEATILRKLNEKDIQGIPRILDTYDNLGFTTNIQTFIDGMAIKWIINTQNFRDIALSATSWLVDLAKKTKSVPPVHWHKSLVEDVIAELATKYYDILTPAMIQKTEDLLSDIEIPFLICEHRDFHPVNVYYESDGKIGVIDWETSRMQGLPAIDLLTFLTHSCILYMPDAKNSLTILERYRLMLDESSDTGSVFRECLKYYTSELGIPASMIPQLRLLNCVIQLHWKYCVVDPPQSVSLTSKLSYKLWEEEINLANKI